MKAEVSRADALVRDGRPVEAVNILRTLLTRHPDDPDLRRRLAEAYLAANNRERAFHHFNRAAHLFSSFGEAESAARMWIAADGVSPNEPDVLFRLAQAQLGLGLGDSTSTRATLSRLVVAASAAKDRRRLFALDALHRLEPANVALAIQRARALEEVDRLDDALAAWQALNALSEIIDLAERHMDRPSLSASVVRLLLDLHRPQDALKLARRALDHHPEDIEIVQVTVRALEILGPAVHLIQARIALVRLLAKDPGRKQAPVIDEVNRLTTVAPSNPEVLEAASAVYAQFGMQKESILVELRLAQVHDAEGRPQARDRALARLLKIDPHNREGLRMGVLALRQAGQEEQAQALEDQLFADETRAVDPSGDADDAHADAHADAETYLLIDLEGGDDQADATTSKTRAAQPSPLPKPSKRHLTADLLADPPSRPFPRPMEQPEAHPDDDSELLLFAADQETTAGNRVPRYRRPSAPLDPADFDLEAPTLSHNGDKNRNPDETDG